MQIAGKKILITGASKGIGKATALLLAQNGAEIIVHYHQDREGAEEVKGEIESLGGKATTVQADIADEVQVKEMFKVISGIYPGGIDVLINNAGIFAEADSPEATAVFSKIFTTNFLGQIYVTNEFLQQTEHGKIIFISSIHGRIGHGRPSAIAYSSLKAALDSYMKNLAKYLAPKIIVNSIAPGKTETAMWGEMSAEAKSEHAKDHLINRWITPDEIADGVLFVLKNDAICGEILTLDGGMSLKTLG